MAARDRPCTVPDCSTPSYVRGWCTLHYQRWRRHGDPLLTEVGMDFTLEERFMVRVLCDVSSRCWLWQGFLNHGGYGRFSVSHEQSVQAHRWAYEHFVAVIPDGLTIDHLCRVRSCVNPQHLEPVTIRENLMRGDTPAARNSAKTHCVNGHEFTPDNLYSYRGDAPHWRRCRACRQASNRRLSARRKATRAKRRAEAAS